MVGGEHPLKRKFSDKCTTSCHGSHADQRFAEIWRILIFIAVIRMEYEITNNVH